jgi:hypothetical protein
MSLTIGGKFTAGVNDTGGHIFSDINTIAVTPAANFLPISMPPAAN